MRLPAGTAGQFLVLTALLAAPGVLAIAALARVAPGHAAVVALSILLVVAGSAVVTVVYLRDMAALARQVDALGPQASDDGPPPDLNSEASRSLSGRLARLQDRWRRHDRTQERRLEDARSIMEAIGDPLMLLSADRVVINANSAALSLFGDRIKGRDLASLLRHPEILSAVDGVAADGAPRTVSYTTPVPVERVYQADISPFRSGDDTSAILISLHDITKIKRSEQMRADFVANASHELRTPLSALSGFIETLEGPARDDEEARTRFLRIMGQQTERMSRLVHDLLSLSHIELDEHTPPRGRCDLRRVVAGVIAVLEMKAAEREMTVVVDAPDDLPDIPGDPDQLTQVFQNLLANAIAYGRTGTEVTIRIRPASAAGMAQGVARGMAVSVRDRGEGMASEHLPRLTERFYRVDPARSRALGGTGLGLAIVKHIVNRHRGRMTVESDIGEGSTFTVFLPISSERDEMPGQRV